MRVLGVDCGTDRTGYGVIESDGKHHRLLGAGTIRTDARQALPERLREIARSLRQVIEEFHPAAVAVEEVFHAVNARSALKLAHARGVALLVIAEAGLPCGEYSALSVKKSVCGYGRAEKKQVQFMIRSILGPEAPTELPDACDALAVAICHATTSNIQVGAAR